MKFAAFNLISLFNYYIFKLLFFSLWMAKEKEESKFSINSLNTAFFEQAFWDNREYIRPQEIYSLLFPQGIYSLDRKTDPIPKASLSPLPFPSFLFILILKAPNTTFFFLFGWERGN